MLFLFFCGALITALPFFAFEFRHGFNQIKAVINAFSHYGGIIPLKGITKVEILQNFFGKLGVLLQINQTWAYVIEVVTVIYFFFALKYRKLKLQENEKRLLLVLFAVSTSILFIYLTARNPVWSYHFIGTEIIFLLLIPVVVKKIPVLKYLLTVWVLYMVFLSVQSFTQRFNSNLLATVDLYAKEHIVDLIAHDAGNTFYTVFNHSPSIYQFEYTYLFQWRHNKNVPYDPSAIPTSSNLVYLIFPPISEAEKDGYSNYRTPNTEYKTVRKWEMPSGMTIVKRTRINAK